MRVIMQIFADDRWEDSYYTGQMCKIHGFVLNALQAKYGCAFMIWNDYLNNGGLECKSTSWMEFKNFWIVFIQLNKS